MKSVIHEVSASRRTVMVSVLAIVIVGGVVAFMFISSKRTAKDFEDCKAMGGVIMESYPEQCRVNGMTFVNESQSLEIPSSQADEYVGLTETEALQKAKETNTPARVVERDGDPLPVTMDFVYGRVNLHVKGGKVYSADIEGQATDTK